MAAASKSKSNTAKVAPTATPKKRTFKPPTNRMRFARYAAFKPNHAWAATLAGRDRRTMQEWDAWYDGLTKQASR